MTTPLATLDNPAWGALTGPQAHLAERVGGAARFLADVSPFTAIADPADPAAWADLATLVGPGVVVVLVGVDTAPDGWTVAREIPGVRLVAASLDARADDEAVVLGASDVPEMLDLVARTEPGPFLPRTIELGTYLGIRREGALVAMAGERLHPPGGTEISAVCTDASVRGQGLASRLVRAVAAGIVARGETPFLHAAASNTGAIALYRRLGFGPPQTVSFTALRSPGEAPAGSDPEGNPS